VTVGEHDRLHPVGVDPAFPGPVGEQRTLGPHPVGAGRGCDPPLDR
jgi:hypothetical protein